MTVRKSRDEIKKTSRKEGGTQHNEEETKDAHNHTKIIPPGSFKKTDGEEHASRL